jgi:hypothetical protein
MSECQGSPRKSETARRIIYLLVALTVVLPYFFPLEQPFTPSPEVRQVYEKIDSLKPGDHVLLSFDYDPSSEAELYPMSLSLLRHCFKKGVIPVVMTHWVTSIGLCQKAYGQAAADANSAWNKKIVPGEDYVFLGYRLGGYSLVLMIGDDIRGAFETDTDGRPTRGMKALEGVNSLKDFKLLVDLAAGDTVNMWIAYGADRAHIPMATGTTAVMAPDLYPFYQSKQLIGFLGGLRGAADYEKLLKFTGRGEQGMLAQSATHVLMILLILGANIRLLAGRFFGKTRN